MTIKFTEFVRRVVPCNGTWLSMLAMVVISGCGGVSYLEQPHTKGTDLSGHWQLIKPTDAELKAWVSGLNKKHEQQLHREARRLRDGDEPPPSSGQFSNLQWMGEQDRREVIELIAWLMPATQLDIKQSGREIEVRSDKGQGTRRLVAGESMTAFLTIGAFDVSSGWKNDSYMVRASGRKENNVEVVEQYTLRSGGKQLEEQMDIEVPMIGKRKFTFIYERQ